MRTIIKKILWRLTATLVFCLTLLISFVFNPSFLYAKKTTHKNFVIHHTRELDNNLITMLDASLDQLKNRELFNSEIKINVCLNDGSYYPVLIKTLMGPDVVRSFANISVVYPDNLNVEKDELIVNEWNNESFKASQWFTHSFAHCLQYKKYGFFGSYPIARHALWKWEGYADYTSYGTSYDLSTLIKKHLEQTADFWIEAEDGSKTNKNQLKFLTMVKYCIEIKQMTYDQILESKDSPDKVYSDMLSWYNNQN
jgi:hypothetical protein